MSVMQVPSQPEFCTAQPLQLAAQELLLSELDMKDYSR